MYRYVEGGAVADTGSESKDRPTRSSTSDNNAVTRLALVSTVSLAAEVHIDK